MLIYNVESPKRVPASLLHIFRFASGGGLISIAGCPGFGAAEHRYELTPENVLPADIARAHEEVREAYRFAIANRDTLRYIPVLLRLRRKGAHEQCIVLSQRQLNCLETDI